MCVDYKPPSKDEIQTHFRAIFTGDQTWGSEAYQDYQAPIIRAGNDGERIAVVGTYGMVPKKRLPPKVRFTTMNARSETVGTLRSYKSAWQKSQLCLVPMQAFYEPNWETGVHIRYRIGMTDESPFAVAGLWQEWEEPEGLKSYSFTQLTINADDDPVMKRFHKPEDEKRSLVILREDEYDDWLQCKDPERARSFLTLFDSKLLSFKPEPRAPKKKTEQSKLI